MKLFLQFLAAMLVGTAIGAYALPRIMGQNTISSTNSAQSAATFDGNLSHSLVDNLQQQLLEAGKERKKLEQQIQALLDQQESSAADTGGQNSLTITTNSADPALDESQGFRQLLQDRRNPQTQQQRLLDAGFSVDELAAIERANTNRTTSRLEARLEAMRENPAAYEQELDPFGYQAIRDEIGDDRFADYLQASGRNATVTTREVVPGSAAELAGLQEGDQIYSYDGSRVFQPGDVTRGTISGNRNENVIIEVKRDNELVTISAPRGALGVSLGFRRDNRRGGGRPGT